VVWTNGSAELVLQCTRDRCSHRFDLPTTAVGEAYVLTAKVADVTEQRRTTVELRCSASYFSER
jgi:hypothetical protein